MDVSSVGAPVSARSTSPVFAPANSARLKNLPAREWVYTAYNMNPDKPLVEDRFKESEVINRMRASNATDDEIELKRLLLFASRGKFIHAS